MATVIKTKSNKKIVLLDPADKGKRYARQLKSGKVTETGQVLSNTDKAFRAGYLKARNDSAKAYMHNKKKQPSESRLMGNDWWNSKLEIK